MPLALVARVGGAMRLAAVDGQARRAGLAPGMTLADARARCPALATLPHDPEADARLLARLAEQMIRLTPLVAPDPPDGLLLDITGCAHLFADGEAGLVRAAMAGAGLAARHALAPHAAAARALARHGAEGEADVRRLPVLALELPDEALAGLRRAGLATLGDLAARPMAGLAARFGEEAVRRLRAILGEADSPIVPFRPRVPVRAAMRLAEPVARTGDVLEVIEALLADCAGQMAERRLGGRRFVVTLERTDGARRQLAVDTTRPQRDPAPVMRLLRERIETLADPLDPGFGFDAIALAVPRLEPLAVRQIGTDGALAEEDDIAALLDRLVTRLGSEAILRLHPRGSHVPERAQRLIPAVRRAPVPWPLPGEGVPRPLLLLDPPEPVTAIAGVPDGPPQRFRWRGRLHVVRLAEGPERIAPEWWRRLDGHLEAGAGLTRDYYRIEDEAAGRYWLFRRGLFSETGDPRWYVHGLFP